MIVVPNCAGLELASQEELDVLVSLICSLESLPLARVCFSNIAVQAQRSRRCCCLR